MTALHRKEGVRLEALLVYTLPRKIITASLAATLYSIGYSVVTQGSDGLTIAPFLMVYIVPIMMIYGVITSLLSDVMAWGAAYRRQGKLTLVHSGFLHLGFGMILMWASLPASFLFFVIDQLLRKYTRYSWIGAGISLCVPITVWLLLLIYIHWAGS